MLQELTGYFNSIKKKKTQAAMKVALCEIKKGLQETSGDRRETGTQVNSLDEEEEVDIWPDQSGEAGGQRDEKRLRNLWDIFEHSNIMGVPGGEEEEMEIENLFEQMVKENFPNLAKEVDFQEVQEAQRFPKKLDPMKNTPRHIIITLPKIKDKERRLGAARDGETAPYKGVPIRLSADFSRETLQARRGWKEVFEVMKGRDLHPRLLYSAKLSFIVEGHIKCFPDRVKLKEFIITKPLLYEMLKGPIQEKEDDQNYEQ